MYKDMNVFPLGILPLCFNETNFTVLKGLRSLLRIIHKYHSGLFVMCLFLEQKIVLMKIIDSKLCGPILFTCLLWEMYRLFLQFVC